MKNILLLILVLITIDNQLLAQNKKFEHSTIFLEPLDINTPFCDFGPAIINGELYFSSLNVEKEPHKSTVQFFDLFSIPLHEAGISGEKGSRQMALISEFHDGPISYCETTGELFITRSDFENAKIKKGIVKKTYVCLGIVVYYKEQDGWTFKEEFPYNSPDYSVGHPAINATGDTLVFVSDKKGGYGKTDLYFSVRKDGVWQEPQNLGPEINSKKRELTPFINNNGKLYFASDGHQGNGNLDLFWSELVSSQYAKPQNLGKPINSKADDFGFTLHPNQLIGYFTSNRKNSIGKDDIYCIKVEGYDIEILSIDSAKQEIDQKAEVIKNDLKVCEKEMKGEKFISNNVLCIVNFEILEMNRIPDLKITYSYELTNDTLRLGQNVYNLGEYRIEESNAVMVILAMLKKSIEGELSKYFTANKKIKISVNGNADAFSLNENTLYMGEFGSYIQEECLNGNDLQTYKVISQNEIDKEELAFLRSYGIRNYIMSEIDVFKHTKNSFSHEIISGGQLNTNHKWVTIELTIQNAFGNF